MQPPAGHRRAGFSVSPTRVSWSPGCPRRPAKGPG